MYFANQVGVNVISPEGLLGKTPIISTVKDLARYNGAFIYRLDNPWGRRCNLNNPGFNMSVVKYSVRAKQTKERGVTFPLHSAELGTNIRMNGISSPLWNPDTGKIANTIYVANEPERYFGLLPYNANTRLILEQLRNRLIAGDPLAFRVLSSIITRRTATVN